MMRFDAIIIGAGAAGLMAAIETGRSGRSVCLIDHTARPGEKIRISGGGRCNFTNRELDHLTARDRFLSQNPRFALSALSRYSPQDFITRLDRAGIAWHEKHKGQLFCDGKASQIVDMLTRDLREAGGTLSLDTTVETITREGTDFHVTTSQGLLTAPKLVIATGGKSIPKMGATGIGYKIAEQFGLSLTETRPALVPLTFAEQELVKTKPLAGTATPVTIQHNKTRFDEDLLFTHRGLSGPAILQISSYWRDGDPLTLDLLPGQNIARLLADQRQEKGRMALHNALARWLPEKIAALAVAESGLQGRLADQNNAKLEHLATYVHQWQIKPVGSEGYRTAEVTLGGVSTKDLDAKTMEAKSQPGLFFIGEVVDVTGWLGGYNFQWAWASGFAAGKA
ncbi:NAD(P)/FAD-dependent oxidoreductase [Thioclava sp. GXIMD4215]|uniref:NAD(P)/FAD-dependent oxidoreductase n=1 Tax=Thioclava sp. GXIMD4215 TaxID=3131928 RepID=UPI00311AE0D6